MESIKSVLSSGKDNQPIIVKAEGNGTNCMVVQSHRSLVGPIFIEKITGKKLHALQRSNAPLIEFIGIASRVARQQIPLKFHATPVSITISTMHMLLMAPGLRDLKYNFYSQSVSGIGIYRHWNTDGPTMPQVYENADFRKEVHDYGTLKNIRLNCSIALGTNDLSNGDGASAITI